MNAKDGDSGLHWVSAKALAIPTDYKKICDCSPEKIDRSHSALTQASNRKLVDYYQSMGRGEIRSLQSRLFFVTAMLLEQTAESTNKRDMIRKLRELHRDNPLLPSVATVYRVAAPLKVWLARKCGLEGGLSVGSLRNDRRPLLMLTEENLLELAAECKTVRKFAEKYRPRRSHKEAAQEPAEMVKTTPEEPAPTTATMIIIYGKITRANRQKIATIIRGEGQLFDLSESQAATVRRWIK